MKVAVSCHIRCNAVFLQGGGEEGGKNVFPRSSGKAGEILAYLEQSKVAVNPPRSGEKQ